MGRRLGWVVEAALTDAKDLGMKISQLLIVLALTGTTAARAENVTTQHEGIKLNATLEQVNGNWPSGPVILMTHGTLAHGRMEIMTNLQKLLAEAGFSSLSITLGLNEDDRKGMYDCDSSHTHQHADAAKEIGAWLDWLEQEGARRVILLGHSRGGNQTAWFADGHDLPMVEKVVLLAPQIWNEQRDARDYEARFGTPLKPILDKAEALTKSGRPDAELESVGFVYCKDATVSAQSFVSYYSPDPRRDTPYLVTRLRQPVLIILGTEDDNYPTLHESFVPLAQAGAAEVVELEGADHFFRDLYAEEAVDSIVEFIR